MKINARRLAGRLPAIWAACAMLGTTFVPSSSDITRPQWHQDLNYLVRELTSRHANAFHHTSREQYDAAAAALDAKLDSINTFSAAMANAAHFRYQTNAILVGRSVGEKPNSYQEPREFTLPNSHWSVRYSTKYYTFAEGGENIIRPDQEIEGTWDDYKAGRDRALDWVLQYKGN